MSNTTECVDESCSKEKKEGSTPPPDPEIHERSEGKYYEEESDMPDLDDFVNQRTEQELDKMFSGRYTMKDPLYIAVTNGFPDPVTVYPWNVPTKRSHDYSCDNRRGAWQRRGTGNPRRNGGMRHGWGDFGKQRYGTEQSPKRRRF